ncbi:hypothetical protein EON66_04545, partial [archaeon]
MFVRAVNARMKTEHVVSSAPLIVCRHHLQASGFLLCARTLRALRKRKDVKRLKAFEQRVTQVRTAVPKRCRISLLPSLSRPSRSSTSE